LPFIEKNSPENKKPSQKFFALYPILRTQSKRKKDCKYCLSLKPSKRRFFENQERAKKEKKNSKKGICKIKNPQSRKK
jgi:hypothetical protein